MTEIQGGPGYKLGVRERMELRLGSNGYRGKWCSGGVREGRVQWGRLGGTLHQLRANGDTRKGEHSRNWEW